jgi:hypothetical protein
MRLYSLVALTNKSIKSFNGSCANMPEFEFVNEVVSGLAFFEISGKALQAQIIRRAKFVKMPVNSTREPI